MKPLRFAAMGAGYWARFQLGAWKELPDVECVAIYNRTREKAEELANVFGIATVYDDPDELLRREQPDFIDVITAPDTHARYVELAAAHGVPVVCQKPMAQSLEEAEHMVQVCREAAVPLIIHENFRWQTAIRQVKHELASGIIGRPFHASIRFCSSYPVFTYQPYLGQLDRLILADMGSHLLDVARFFFGDADRLCCQTGRVHPGIRGEDVATVMLQMGGVTCVCDMSYSSILEHEHHPDTLILIEGEKGSIELGHDYWVRVTTADGTRARRYLPPRYPWAVFPYEAVHASIVSCNASVVEALRTGTRAETDAEDNIQTMRLVFAAYDSAASGEVVALSH